MPKKIPKKKLHHLKVLLKRENAPDWLELNRSSTIVDIHMHPVMKRFLFGKNPAVRSGTSHSVNVTEVEANFPMLHMGGYDLIASVAHAPEIGLVSNFPILNLLRLLPPLWKRIFARPPFERTTMILDEMESVVKSSATPARILKTRSALDAFFKEPKKTRGLGFVHVVEGGHSLGDDRATDQEILENLDNLKKRGVAYITLAHFYPNRLVHPCYPYPEDMVKFVRDPDVWPDISKGLTELGKKVVRRMVEIEMLIDVSHCTPLARKQIFEICDSFPADKHIPVMATHVGVWNINPCPYNLRDDEISWISRRGGIIGVIFMNYWLVPWTAKQGINHISHTIAHMIKVGGEDAVGIGSDFDGFTDPPDDLYNPLMIGRLTQRLISDGYSTVTIRKILGENAVRVLRHGLNP